jgi:hypothetical protein
VTARLPDEPPSPTCEGDDRINERADDRQREQRYREDGQEDEVREQERKQREAEDAATGQHRRDPKHGLRLRFGRGLHRHRLHFE